MTKWLVNLKNLTLVRGDVMELILGYLANPVIRMAVVGVGSLSFAGIYMWVKGEKAERYDTITDLKKKAKVFTKMNYQNDKTNHRQGI